MWCSVYHKAITGGIVHPNHNYCIWYTQNIQDTSKWTDAILTRVHIVATSFLQCGFTLALVTKYTDITLITIIPAVNINMFNMVPMLIVSTPFQELCLWLSHLTNFCINYSWYIKLHTTHQEWPPMTYQISSKYSQWFLRWNMWKDGKMGGQINRHDYPYVHSFLAHWAMNKG